MDENLVKKLIEDEEKFKKENPELSEIHTRINKLFNEEITGILYKSREIKNILGKQIGNDVACALVSSIIFNYCDNVDECIFLLDRIKQMIVDAEKKVIKNDR